MISPCKGCDSRQVGCHSECEAFKAWKHAREEIKSAMESDRRIEDYVAGERAKSCLRYQRSSKKKIKVKQF